MSKVKDRIKERDTRGAFPREIVEEPLLRMFREKFEGLAPICIDRVVASNDDAICTYHESSPTDCRFSICPKLDLPLGESVRIERDLNPKRRENHE